MSPVIPSCILCGWVVAERPGVVSWVNQFRALVPDPQAGIILTGVGLHDDPFSPTPFAPRHSSARWDQPGYDNRDPLRAAESNQIILVLRHHVVFHDSCLRLFGTLMHLDQHAFARIGHICASLPFPTRGTSLSWGHDYGGLVRIEDEDFYPWEDRYSDQVFQEAIPMYTADPLHGTEALDILTERPIAPPRPRKSLLPPRTGTTAQGSSAHHDPLSALPLEICTMIADELSVADYLSVRLASRAMWPIFHYQAWWRNKFYAQTHGPEDRSWFIEAWEAQDRLIAADWRYLYRRTRHDQLSPGLKNRKRIWRILQGIPAIVGLDLDTQEDLSATTSSSTSTSIRPRVEARLRPPRRGYESSEGFDGEGCREKYSQAVAVPANVTTIAVHIVRLGDASYICGLEMTNEQGETVCAGYRSSSKEEVCLNGDLRGFIAAVGCRGFHALQIVAAKREGDITTTAWLGDATADCAKTERLALGAGKITEMEARFDGCKIVSLTASSPGTQAPRPLNLKNAAFWYPDIPGPHLHCNDNPTLPKDSFMNEYQPIFWTQFGGPGGCRLRHLTGIGVLLHRYDGIAQVEFYFDDGPGFEGTQLVLGRCRPADGANLMRFAINGPAGERIREVDVLHRVPKASGAASDDAEPQRPEFVTFKISTNWGRSCLFKPPARRSTYQYPYQHADDEIRMQHVPIEPGTSITGFYADQRPELGFGVTIVGVISEKVDEEELAAPARPLERSKRRRLATDETSWADEPGSKRTAL